MTHGAKGPSEVGEEDGGIGKYYESIKVVKYYESIKVVVKNAMPSLYEYSTVRLLLSWGHLLIRANLNFSFDGIFGQEE